MDDRKLDKLEKLINLVDEDYVKSDEFVEAFGILLGVLKDVSENSEESVASLKDQAESIREVVLSERKLSRKLQEQFNNRLDTFKTELHNAIYEIKSELPELREALDGRDGTDGRDGKDGKDGSPDTGEEIIGKINGVDEKGPKIDAKHIKNLPEATQQIIHNSYPGGFVETPIKAGANITIGTDASGAKVISSNASGSGAVDSVNGQTGVVVLDADDIDDTSTTQKFVTAADITKLGNLSGTNTGDQTSIVGITGTKAQFDTAVTDGNFLYVGDVTTNATHTGEVTGSGALTVDKTAITNRTEVSAALGDYTLIADASDSNNLKKVTIQTIADLASGSGVAESLAIAYAVSL